MANAANRYLKPMLTAGSSRVFNINEVYRKLTAEEVEDRFLFKNQQMHSLIVIKEALTPDRDEPHPDKAGVGTKLYFPYNMANVYEGGRSAMLHSANLADVLHDQLGLHGEKLDDETSIHDIKVLRVLDRLPSLDGFLMSDALELEGFVPNERYFEITPAERFAIQEYIRNKIEPLVRAAYAGQQGISSKVSQLVDKIWEAKDMDSLQHFIRAFHFPVDEAPQIFAAWKGINYYSFEYLRTKAKREEYALWLKDGAVPRDLVPKNVMSHVEALRRHTIERLRDHWREVEGIIREYDAVYTQFVEAENVGPFVKFLRNAKEAYWRLGDALSKISHAINCWEHVTSVHSGRRLPCDRLAYLLEMSGTILAAKAAVRGDSINAA